MPRTYILFQQEDDRARRVFATMLANVSCRNYRKAIETVQQGAILSTDQGISLHERIDCRDRKAGELKGTLKPHN
jgi:hypothetical protein